MTFFQKWFLAMRPKTLTASCIPIGIGTALAKGMHGSIRMHCVIFALMSAVLIQIGTNFINDALDFKDGIDSTERVGPLRVTQRGLLSFNQVFFAGIGCFLFSILFAVPLVQVGGWPIIGIGVLSIICGYLYSGGPCSLAALGLSELFVFIFFGWISVMGTYYLHTHQWTWRAWIAGSQIGFLATALIAINHFRDQVTDQCGNRRTWVVCFGPAFGKIEILTLCFAPFILGLFWWNQGFLLAAILPLLMLPIAIQLVKNIYCTPIGPLYNQFLATAAFLHCGFGVLLSLGFMYFE